MRCPSCSKEIPAGSIVCPFCTTPLDEAVTSASPATAAKAVISAEAPTSAEPLSSEPAEGSSAPPIPSPPPVASSGVSSASLALSDSGQHGSFLPGTTVAERYRIVGLLGVGGMGEVYRADDLKLG